MSVVSIGWLLDVGRSSCHTVTWSTSRIKPLRFFFLTWDRFRAPNVVQLLAVIFNAPCLLSGCSTHSTETPGCVIKSLCNHCRSVELTKTGRPHRWAEWLVTNTPLIAGDKNRCRIISMIMLRLNVCVSWSFFPKSASCLKGLNFSSLQLVYSEEKESNCEWHLFLLADMFIPTKTR